MTPLLGSSTQAVAWILVELGAVLLMLAVLARLARRTGFSPIPLYLLAGLGIAAVSPLDLNSTMIEVETQVAVILLLFMLGIEYNVPEISESLRTGLPAGLMDIALNFTPGFLAGLLLGWSPLECLLLGGVTAISSSSITAKVLDDLNRLGNQETPAVLSVLVFEDLAMALYLPLVAVMIAGGGLAVGTISITVAVGAVVIMMVIAARHSHRVTRRVSHDSDEVVLLTICGLLLIAGGFGEALRVSAGVVAFLIGLTITGSLAERTRQLLEPLRDLFAALFFVFFGLQVDIAHVPDVLGAAVVLWLVTSATKFITGWYGTRKTSGVPGRFRAGTALVARGEFSIVIAGLAVAAGSSSLLAPLAATYVLICAITGPLLTRYADDLARRSLAIVRRLR